MKISTKALRDAMGILSPICKAGPLAANIRIRVGDCAIVFAAMGAEEWTKIQIPVEGKTNLEACVSESRLKWAIQNAQEDEIELNFEVGKVGIKSGGSAVLMTTGVEVFMEEPTDTFKEIGMEVKDFARLLRRLAFVPLAKSEDITPFVRAVKIVCNGHFEFDATQRHIYAWVKWPTAAGEMEAFLPREKIARLCDACERPGARISKGEKWLLVETNDSKHYFLLHACDKWPAHKNEVPRFSKVGLIPAEAFQREVGICASLCSWDRGDHIQLECDDNGMKVKANIIGGDAEYESTIEGKFKPMSVRINPNYLGVIAGQFEGEINLMKHESGTPMFADAELAVIVQELRGVK